MQQETPNDLLCPITRVLFEDPVVTADGQTYERAAILMHFRTKNTSPVTNEVLPHKNLVPNVRMKSQCIEWQRKHDEGIDIDSLLWKCFQAKNFQGIIETITEIIELVTKSDTCILQMSRLKKIIPEDNVTKEVESLLGSLQVMCKEKHHEGIKKKMRFREMRKVNEESVVVLEAKIKEDNTVKVAKAAFEKAKKKLAAAKKRLEAAKTNMEKVEEAIEDAQKIYNKAVEAQKKQTDRLNSLKKLTKTFQEEETRLSAVMEPLDDTIDENVPPVASNSRRRGKKRKSRSSSSNSAVKRQKIENKGAQNLFELGIAKHSGIDFQKFDKENGQRMIESAAIAGFPTAIAICKYLEWNGYKTDDEKTFKMFMDNSDYSYAQCYIGRCYQYGRGVAEDHKEAFKWYTKSANLCNSMGQLNLGVCYDDGHGVAVDKKEALKWYTKSANLGNSFGQFQLGNCYDFGDGVAEDKKEAFEWFMKSANLGNSFGQYFLGNCYFSGQGVAIDKKEGFRWFMKSANACNNDAQVMLGICYCNGEGVAEDKKEGFKWFTKSANAGNSKAQCELGVCYFYGFGVAENRRQAFYWCTKSANAGIITAQEFLDEHANDFDSDYSSDDAYI
eukprot:GSMAST32.ASY1.ANO1.2375.1 assembled CDS